MFDKFDISNITANDGILISVVGYLVVFVSLHVGYFLIVLFENVIA